MLVVIVIVEVVLFALLIADIFGNNTGLAGYIDILFQLCWSHATSLRTFQTNKSAGYSLCNFSHIAIVYS